MVRSGGHPGGVKLGQNRPKPMVLSSNACSIGEGVKKDGVMPYECFHTHLHPKWWFNPEQKIWWGLGFTHGGAKVRQNRWKSMVLTCHPIITKEGVQMDWIMTYECSHTQLHLKLSVQKIWWGLIVTLGPWGCTTGAKAWKIHAAV